MTIPPQGSAVVRNAPTKGRLVVRRRLTKHKRRSYPELDWGRASLDKRRVLTKHTRLGYPELDHLWRQLVFLAPLLLAAVVVAVRMLAWLAGEDQQSERLAQPASVGHKVTGRNVDVVKGNVDVVEGDVRVIDRD